MYKVRTSDDVRMLENKFSSAVIEEAKRLTAIFDENYNSESVDGGFVAVVENSWDLEYLKEYYFAKKIKLFLLLLFHFVCFYLCQANYRHFFALSSSFGFVCKKQYFYDKDMFYCEK